MEKPLDSFEYCGYTVELYPDFYRESPYEEGWCLSQIYHWHRRGFTGTNIRADIAAAPGDSLDDKVEFVAKAYGLIVWEPLYLYEHGGQTVNLTGYTCPWDSGQVGIVGVTRKALLGNTGGYVTKKKRAYARDIIEKEVRAFDRWLTGESYGVSVVAPDGAVVDSVWGIDDWDYAKQLGREIVDERTTAPQGAG